jgi:hypothetical protein
MVAKMLTHLHQTEDHLPLSVLVSEFEADFTLSSSAHPAYDESLLHLLMCMILFSTESLSESLEKLCPAGEVWVDLSRNYPVLIF